jgi:hypothetical protein
MIMQAGILSLASVLSQAISNPSNTTDTLMEDGFMTTPPRVVLVKPDVRFGRQSFGDLK